MFASLRYKFNQDAKHQSPGCGCAGFSLLEVLIASTIFSFGLAGFAALLLTSLVSSAEARREGVASVAAANLAEQLRMNPVALSRYLNPPAQVPRICAGETLCTPEQQADYDYRLWQIGLADSIKNASGLICRDGTPSDGVDGNARCDGSGPLVIKIFWRGQAGADNSQHRYILELS